MTPNARRRLLLLLYPIIGMPLVVLMSLGLTALFFSGIREVPADFLSGELTLDGILIAVVAVSTVFPTIWGIQLSDQLRFLAAILSAPFVVSALTALYYLLRLRAALSFPGLAVPMDFVVFGGLEMTILGLLLWAYDMVYLRYILPPVQKTTP